jgi:hypothetical protein
MWWGNKQDGDLDGTTALSHYVDFLSLEVYVLLVTYPLNCELQNLKNSHLLLEFQQITLPAT